MEPVSTLMTLVVLIAGLPDWIPNLIGFAGTFILLLIIVAIAGFAYKTFVGGGVEWPEDVEDEDDGVRQGDPDDEWDYY